MPETGTARSLTNERVLVKRRSTPSARNRTTRKAFAWRVARARSRTPATGASPPDFRIWRS